MKNLIKNDNGLDLGNATLVSTGATQNYVYSYTYTATEKCIVFVNVTSTGSGAIAQTLESTGVTLLRRINTTSYGYTGNLIAICEKGQTANVYFGQNNWTTSMSCSKIVLE